MNKSTWFALLRVEPINGNTDLGDAIGAYVNVAYPALDKDDFLIIVWESFKSFDFKIVEVEHIERGDDLSIVNPSNAEKLILLKRVMDGEELAWGTFHTYHENE